MKARLINLGCKVNRVETDSFAAALRAAGYDLAEQGPADLVIVNTCTVTGDADKKARKAVRHALRDGGNGRIVVTDCAAAISPEAFMAMSDRVEVVGKGDLAERMGKGALRVGAGFRTRVGVKVQDGCDNACTYCIVHVARGKAVSRAADDAVDEVRGLVSAGAREIVLTGINLGSYRSGGITLTGLLEMLLSLDGETRFRISSIEPRDVDDDLISLLASSGGRVCRHLHMPLQSGSERVLREMARPYDAAFYRSLAGRLAEDVPGLSLSTDVIVGFPGESEDDFAETLDMLAACAFSKTHVFRYSRREGTPAARRTDQVAAVDIAHRARTLQEAADAQRMSLGRSRCGDVEMVLVETGGMGMTESYYPVKLPEVLADEVGKLLPLRLTGIDEDGIFSV